MTIVDLGEYGTDFIANPYPYYARLRESGPVHEVRLSNGEEMRLIVGHDEARAALAVLCWNAVRTWPSTRPPVRSTGCRAF
ncbi:hypothetical protein AB0D12_04380 [Streptomyces sp. NPDC048479]|uniref:hypothetical protein n=1 Tax=Streptomyces sp. NPDC048479 TaxID=3154725 RepID=UPI00343B49F6